MALVHLIKIEVGQGKLFGILQFVQLNFSSNLTIFDHKETRFEHYEGNLVKYDNKTIVIGGSETAEVEEMKSRETPWTEHSMSPVNGFWGLRGFTAVSIDQSLFIFGQLHLLELKIN